MRIITGTSEDLQSTLMTEMARYRHRVFVEKLGWKLHHENGLEYDQFDRDDTVYVVAQNDDHEVVGTARLLPTTRPYLLGNIFPQLLNGLPPPASEEFWELSRFAAVDLNSRTIPALGQFSSPVAVDLIRSALAYVAAFGGTKVITVSPLGVERLLARAGFQASRAGVPISIDGGVIAAYWINV